MATIIDALVITLGLDASDYQKNSQKFKKDTQSLTDEQKKQLDKVERQAKQALNAVASVQKGIIGMFAAVAGATGITQFLSQVNQAEAALGRLSSHTGQSTQDLQKWGNMAALVGGSAEDMQAGMSNLQQQLTDLKYKGEMGGTVTFLAQMGVAVANTNGEMRKQSDIMLDLSDRAKGMKKEDFYNLASSSGMTDSQIDVIMKGRTELEKMLIAQEENALVTKEQAEEARKLQAEWELMKQSIFSAGVRILHDLMPIIQAVAEGLRTFFNFLQKHRGFIYGFFTALAIVMLPVLITTTAIVAQFLFMAAPIIAISAAIGLLIDDFITWKEGGESLFGTFYDWFDKLIDKVTGFGDLLRAIFTGDWDKVQDIVKAKLIQPIENAHQNAVDYTSDKIEKTANALAKIDQKAAKATQSIKNNVEAVGTMIVGSLKMGGEVQEGMQTSGAKKKGALTKFYGGAISGFTDEETLAFANTVLSRENPKAKTDVVNSFGYTGKYQFGAEALAETGFIDSKKVPKDRFVNLPYLDKKTGKTKYKFNGPQHKEFLANKGNWIKGNWEEYKKSDQMQDESFKKLVEANLRYGANLHKGNTKKMAGFAMAAHLKGAGNAKKWYSQGTDSKDGYGTKTSDYANYGENFMDFAPQKNDSKSPPVSNKGQAAIGNATSRVSSSTVETHIGEVNVYTAATDSHGIAREIGLALDNALRFNTYAFDSGLS